MHEGGDPGGFLKSAGDAGAAFGHTVFKVGLWLVVGVVALAAALFAYTLWQPWALDHERQIVMWIGMGVAFYIAGLLNDIRKQLATIAQLLYRERR